MEYSKTTLIIGTNWLGDCVMAMPALQSYYRRHPGTRLIMVTRPNLAALWEMHPMLSAVRVCSGTLPAIRHLARELRSEKIETAYVWPKSFRSALLPWLAGIPQRYGLPGHSRDWMLTSVVYPPQNALKKHQAYEYLALMGDPTDQIEPPALQAPRELTKHWRMLLLKTGSAHWIALLPGAAFGPAKQWPADYFIAAGLRLQKELSAGILVLGSAAERELCEKVATGIGASAMNLAGQTSLSDLASILSLCRLAITNDSGGMHLATAMNVPVVAVFGVTDPETTGPLGARVIVLQDSPYRARDFKPYLSEAAAVLKAVKPAQAVEAARAILAHSDPPPGYRCHIVH